MWRSAGGAAASACCSFTVSNMAYQSNFKKSHPSRQILAHSDRWTHHKHSRCSPSPTLFQGRTRERTLEPCQVQRHQKFLHSQPQPLFVPHASSCYLIPIFRRKCEVGCEEQMFWTSSAGFSTGRPVMFGQDWRPVLRVTSCASRVLPLGFFLPPPTKKKKIVNEHVPPGTSSTARCSVRNRVRGKKVRACVRVCVYVYM